MSRVFILACSILLCSCEKSQSFYDAHPEARSRILQRCSAGSAVGRDCANAAASAAARRHADAEQTFKNMSEGR